MAAPALLLSPFDLFCAPWPGPLAFWEPESLKMLITAGFLLVPRIFLFIKVGQAFLWEGLIKGRDTFQASGLILFTLFHWHLRMPHLICSPYDLCFSLDPQVTLTLVSLLSSVQTYTIPAVLQPPNLN